MTGAHDIPGPGTPGGAASGGEDLVMELLLAQESMRSVLTKVGQAAQQLVGADVQASVTLVERGNPTSASWTGLLAYELDETQFGLDHGPCLEAAVSGHPIAIPDMATETRWPRFTEQARLHGAASSQSTPIPMQHDLQAAINVYGTVPHRFDPDTRAALRTLAGRAAVAISNMHAYDGVLRTVEQLQEAAATRAVIEQAKGLLMGRHGIDAEQAFAVLAAMSQREHRKLRTIAAEMVAEAINRTDGQAPQ